MAHDLDQYQDEENFVSVGGLSDKKGYLITRMCKDPDAIQIRGAAKILLDAVADSLTDGYLLLHASTDRPYLRKIYLAAGFKEIGMLPAGILYDTNTVVFRRIIHKHG